MAMNIQRIHQTISLTHLAVPTIRTSPSALLHPPYFPSTIPQLVLYLCVQIRGIEEVSAVSVLGTLGMLVALTIAAVKICLTARPDSYR